jgi:uncharacterized membrane protein YdjX (TVP38/TMEM64 family)
MSENMLRRHRYKLALLILLVTTGVLLQVGGFLNPETIIQTARQYADHWWLILVIILLQILLFTFALAGSLFLWVAATLYPPVTATIILATGATLGGVSAYLFSSRLTEDWIRRVESSRTYRLLQQQDNFFTLFAMRLMPAFPHAIINYSAGFLKIRFGYFIPATVLGIAIKSYVYAKVIYNASSANTLEELLDITVYGPLILLSALILSGIFLKNWLKNRHPG